MLCLISLVPRPGWCQAAGGPGRGLPLPVTPLPGEVTAAGSVRTERDYLDSSLLVVRFTPGGAEVTLTSEAGEELGRAIDRGSDAYWTAFRLFGVPRAGLPCVVRLAKPGFADASRTVTVPPRSLVHADFVLARASGLERIAYCRESGQTADIWWAWPDGTHAEPLVATGDDERDPCFTPDGRALAYAAGPPGGRRIMLLDLVSREARTLVDAGGDQHSPCFSPDGRLLAFVSDREGDPDIFVAAADGSGGRRVSRRGATDASPSFAPDGKQIVFATDRWGSMDLAIVSLGTGRIERLTDDPRDETDPAWSPDGETIAYTLRAGSRPILKLRSSRSPLGVGPLDDGLPARVALGASQPAWSPDSRVILSSVVDGDRRRVLGLRMRTDWMIPVTPETERCSDATWGRLPTPEEGLPRLRVRTSRGDIVIELDVARAPATVANFLRLVDAGFYNGLSVYRVSPGQLVQLGCPLGNGTGGPAWTLPFENTGLPHHRGAISMVHGDDPNGGGSQFMICLTDLPALDGSFAAFGRVVQGLDTAETLQVGDTIAGIAATNGE